MLKLHRTDTLVQNAYATQVCACDYNPIIDRSRASTLSLSSLYCQGGLVLQEVPFRFHTYDNKTYQGLELE